MTTSYEWRGQFTSAEANSLHAECFEHRVLSDGQWDWRGQVERHSLGWVCARDGAELVGFVNVAWDGWSMPSCSTPWSRPGRGGTGSGPGWSRSRWSGPGRP